MFEINQQIGIPEEEFAWSFVRSGGPGGQNVNKVASKAVLRWDVAATPSLPADVKERFLAQQRQRLTTEGELVLTSQRYRDQDRNRQDCLEKLRALVLQAVAVPKVRKKRKRPSRAAKEARLREKKHRATTKSGRRRPAEE
jgi:ribosome-associated protein